MRAEDTLQYMADFTPLVCPTRKHCLDFLFCVLGSGFRWINGELVDVHDKYVGRYSLNKPIEKAEFENEKNWYEMHEWYKEFYEDRPNKIPMQYRFDWYVDDPENCVCEGSNFYNIPDDIKPDWKELLEECKQMLRADGVRFHE
jgi:hypothetical protein